ncbi:protein of unknown function [Acidithiobacillus ferrivorans]|uniref:Uncharacterized protein n=1 Tax=Acidithiobacillus ferrivorans TaxID=160808 RepID=A0ABY1MM19_9PROT|nr:protein of unknown function [Acidithiobacillus ferrivorans]
MGAWRIRDSRFAAGASREPCAWAYRSVVRCQQFRHELVGHSSRGSGTDSGRSGDLVITPLDGRLARARRALFPMVLLSRHSGLYLAAGLLRVIAGGHGRCRDTETSGEAGQSMAQGATGIGTAADGERCKPAGSPVRREVRRATGGFPQPRHDRRHCLHVGIQGFRCAYFQGGGAVGRRIGVADHGESKNLRVSCGNGHVWGNGFSDGGYQQSFDTDGFRSGPHWLSGAAFYKSDVIFNGFPKGREEKCDE